MTDLSITGRGETADGEHQANPSLNDLIAQRYSRRDALRGGASASAMMVFGGSMLAACGGGGGDDGGSGGSPPTVSISGGNVTVSAGTRVTITGTATDDGSVASTAFTQVSGPAVSLSATSGTTTSFVAPAVNANAVVVIRFTATDDGGRTASADANITVSPAVLSFAAIAKNKLDIVTVPAGYTASVLYRLGDPLNGALPAYSNDGTDANFAGRAGDHHGAMRFFGLQATGSVRDDLANTRGILVVNHENITQSYLHPNGPTGMNGSRPEGEAIKEIEAHGLSSVEVTQAASGSWSYVAASAFNRRITPNTAMAMNGPVRGNGLVQTAFSPGGTDARGTIGTGAGGFTAWGTFMACEEGWNNYFRRPSAADNPRRSAKEVRSLSRYGVVQPIDVYRWSTVTPSNTSDTSFRRWDAQATGSAATADYRNEPNQFGWVVEVDPYDAGRPPRKRTALGRLNHDGCWPATFVAGRKPAWYLADGNALEYFYKFVSATAWDSADAGKADRYAIGDKYLDSGTLYVARFNADGTGSWIPLTFDTGEIKSSNSTYAFADQADVLVNARIAADVSLATPLDRAGWVAVQPSSGEIYVALTNNPVRNAAGTNAINPRVYVDPPSAIGNANGHILRLSEASPEATAFSWDVYLFGSGADLDSTNINVSKLTAENDFSGPEGLSFGRPSNPSGLGTPLLWIRTDDTAFTDVTNNQMLAAIPGFRGDGDTDTDPNTTPIKKITNTDSSGTFTVDTPVGKPATADLIRRFLVGPNQCTVTGMDTTPDGRTMFVNIQHPGRDGAASAPTSNWPASQSGAAPGARPRSATVVIQRSDGGIIGL